jgi:hypothetical protein
VILPGVAATFVTPGRPDGISRRGGPDTRGSGISKAVCRLCGTAMSRSAHAPPQMPSSATLPISPGRMALAPVPTVVCRTLSARGRQADHLAAAIPTAAGLTPPAGRPRSVLAAVRRHAWAYNRRLRAEQWCWLKRCGRWPPGRRGRGHVKHRRHG